MTNAHSDLSFLQRMQIILTYMDRSRRQLIHGIQVYPNAIAEARITLSLDHISQVADFVQTGSVKVRSTYKIGEEGRGISLAFKKTLFAIHGRSRKTSLFFDVF